jgi:septin family protein
LQDLKDVTHDVHYENYRLTCLGQLEAQGGALGEPGAGGERRRMSSKRESLVPAESEYEDPETLMLLQQKDQEIRKMQAMLDQMQQKLNSGP